MAAPTEAELKILSQFRDYISDLELKPDQSGDMKLLAWLRARDLDIEKAKEMLKASLKWRKENDMDNILDWKAPSHYYTDYDHEIVGRGLENRPIIIIPLGVWDIRKTVSKSEEDKRSVQRYVDQIFSKVMNRMKIDSRPGKEITQFTLILDFANFPMRQFTSSSSVEVILDTVRKLEANYPETLYSAYIVNASRVFTMLFALIKPLMSPRTLSKLEIYGPPKVWQPILLKKLPKQQLPREFGGCRLGRRISIGNIPHEELGLKEGIDYVKVPIGPGQKLELEYQIQHPNTKITWKFKMENYDIGFYISYNRQETLLANKRYETPNAEETGSFTCERPGEYFIVFDNTYSSFRGKTVEYIVEVLDQQDELLENADEE